MEILLDSVTKRRGRFALGPIDLRLESGAYALLAGPNGCGKTTLLYLLAGFLTPDGGRIRFDGSEVQDRPPEERDVAFVFSEPALFPHLTAAENVAFQPRAGPLSAEAVGAALEFVGVRDLAALRPAQLSTGQARRVEIARALASKPKLLLMDEAFAFLDPQDRQRIAAAVKALAAERRMTILHVSHQEGDSALGDVVVRMRDGRIEP